MFNSDAQAIDEMIASRQPRQVICDHFNLPSQVC
jgi:hypothetical protein